MLNFQGSIDQLADRFAESLPCRVQKPYPSAHIPVKNRKAADMLLAAYADGGNSELTAITQYLHHAKTISDPKIADTVFCTALIEMLHLDMLGTMIESLGGDPKYLRSNDYYWTGGYVNYGTVDLRKAFAGYPLRTGGDQRIRRAAPGDRPREQSAVGAGRGGHPKDHGGRGVPSVRVHRSLRKKLQAVAAKSAEAYIYGDGDPRMDRTGNFCYT